MHCHLNPDTNTIYTLDTNTIHVTKKITEKRKLGAKLKQSGVVMMKNIMLLLLVLCSAVLALVLLLVVVNRKQSMLLFTTIAAAIPGDVKKTEDIVLGEVIKSGEDSTIMIKEDIKMHPETSFELEIRDAEDLLYEEGNIVKMNFETLGEFEEMEETAKEDTLSSSRYILLLLLLPLLILLLILLLPYT